MSLFGHPIARALETWWREHGGRFDDPQWIKYVEVEGHLARRKAEELLEEHSNGGRFGMSKAGGCTRAAQLKLLGHASEAFSGSSRATFRIGHLIEVMALATLIAAGYDVTDPQLPLEIDPMMRSARDATITLDGKRTLLSVKSIGYKKSGNEWRGKEKVWVRRGFPELPFEGVRRSQPGYWAQLQAECAADNYDQALILFVAKDMVKAMENDPYLGEKGNGSLTFYGELVPADPEFIKNALVPAWTEAWGHVSAGRAGRGLYIHKKENRYVELNPNDDAGNKKALAQGWSPCGWCDASKACKASYDSVLTAQLQASIEMREAV